MAEAVEVRLKVDAKSKYSVIFSRKNVFYWVI